MTDATIESAAWENEFYIKVCNLTSKICSDQKGCFPVISSRGKKYVMVIYDHGSNTIIARALKMKSALEILQNIQEVYKFLNEWGIHLKVHIMDNECLQIVRDYLINSKKI